MKASARRLTSHWCALVAMVTTAGAVTGYADVWDRQRANDNSLATRQALAHGSNELRDLAALPSDSGPVPDEDWFRLAQKSRSSYEIVAEGVSGDLCPLELDRLAADGSTELQASKSVGAGCDRSLRWMNDGAAVADQFIRVRSGSCTTDCGADNVYRLRQYETTYAVPRYNNVGTQVSVLMIQNTSDSRVAGTVYFWRADGSLAASHPFNLNPKAQLVLNTATVVPGLSGAVTVANTARYGELSGKIVGLEPATGFSFDTLMVPRPL